MVVDGLIIKCYTYIYIYVCIHPICYIAMALIEIDGLPFLKMGGSFHGELLNNQMVYIYICIRTVLIMGRDEDDANINQPIALGHKTAVPQC